MPWINCLKCGQLNHITLAEQKRLQRKKKQFVCWGCKRKEAKKNEDIANRL